MAKHVNILNWLLGAVGGIIGGALGYFAFFFMTGQGLYPMVLPGALVGLGCGFLSGAKSNRLGVVCALAAVMLGLYIEWRFAPFARDPSFAYLIAHVHDLKSMTLVMIAIGGLFGFWFGKGREGGVWLRRNQSVAGD